MFFALALLVLLHLGEDLFRQRQIQFFVRGDLELQIELKAERVRPVDDASVVGHLHIIQEEEHLGQLIELELWFGAGILLGIRLVLVLCEELELVVCSGSRLFDRFLQGQGTALVPDLVLHIIQKLPVLPVVDTESEFILLSDACLSAVSSKSQLGGLAFRGRRVPWRPLSSWTEGCRMRLLSIYVGVAVYSGDAGFSGHFFASLMLLFWAGLGASLGEWWNMGILLGCSNFATGLIKATARFFSGVSTYDGEAGPSGHCFGRLRELVGLIIGLNRGPGGAILSLSLSEDGNFRGVGWVDL